MLTMMLGTSLINSDTFYVALPLSAVNFFKAVQGPNGFCVISDGGAKKCLSIYLLLQQR